MARPGQFLGAHSALHVGQALGDLYCSNIFAAAPAGPLVILSGNWVRLRTECVALGYTFFVLEQKPNAPGAGNIWTVAPPLIQFSHLFVNSTGSFLAPLVSLFLLCFQNQIC